MLRRRHLSQTQTARKTERGQEAHEKSRPRRDTSGSIFGGVESQRELEGQRLALEYHAFRQGNGAFEKPQRYRGVRFGLHRLPSKGGRNDFSTEACSRGISE